MLANFRTKLRRNFGRQNDNLSTFHAIVRKAKRKSTKIRLEFSLRFVTSEISRQRNETTVRPFEKKVQTRVKGRLRSSSAIFRNLQQSYKNVRKRSYDLRTTFRTSLFGYVYQINKILHGCLEI